MEVPTSKQQLMDRIRQERAAWEALLGDIGEERMEVPGIGGEWTMKDTIAHLTTWWRREVARVEAARRDECPPDHPPQQDVAVINQWIYLTNRDRPLADVLHDARAVWQHFEASMAALPEHALFAPEPLEWMHGRSLGPGLLDDFVLHLHEEHAPLIRAWLADQQER